MKNFCHIKLTYYTLLQENYCLETAFFISNPLLIQFRNRFKQNLSILKKIKTE